MISIRKTSLKLQFWNYFHISQGQWVKQCCFFPQQIQSRHAVTLSGPHPIWHDPSERVQQHADLHTGEENPYAGQWHDEESIWELYQYYRLCNALIFEEPFRKAKRSELIIQILLKFLLLVREKKIVNSGYNFHVC